ncbi:hypothetical protein AOQ84DRAFT_392093 [Glonium stellatum]|uniref:FAD-binding FR-type domain-containing protein n=1 Tax=Glonium stellatum TaxID=574774 RepID=A0A8E2ERR9_9PEZI|nr:hypothetical protein AOQ84DRAFT_392093 [Glonium stellatum]
MAFSIALPWSSGEEKMHRLMNVPEHDNPTSSMLTPQASFMLQKAPLLAIGTVDDQGQPWTTLWGGEPGFSQPLGASIIGTRTLVDRKYDPVIQILVGGRSDGEVVKGEGCGKMVSGLAIDLMTRKRVKLYGRMIAAALSQISEDENDKDKVPKGSDGPTHGQVQLVVKIEQSLGNCPKYLNKKDIRPAIISSKLLSQSPKLSPEALALVGKADMFFISSYNSEYDMDTNHRGGPPGFVRVFSNDEAGSELVYPEYSGNRLYQTLGNLQTNPVAGLVFPDFETGDVLYATGTVKILIGLEASAILPRSTLALKIRLVEARYVQKGLPFRGIAGELSPYNPNIRLLAEEGSLGVALNQALPTTARLVQKTQITPSICRFRFSMTNPLPYKAGQWVGMDLSRELDIGYSHMRDDDPRSLNDDFIRTFTISSPPTSLSHNEFEITIRKVGTVTSFLFQQSERSEIEVPLRGIGGDFVIQQDNNSQATAPYITSGVGITPLLGQLPNLYLERLALFWTVRADDLELVVDTLKNYPELESSTTVFVTSCVSDHIAKHVLESLKRLGIKYKIGRMLKDDLNVEAKVWYLCAGKGLQETVLKWLNNCNVIYEDFGF